MISVQPSPCHASLYNLSTEHASFGKNTKLYKSEAIQTRALKAIISRGHSHLTPRSRSQSSNCCGQVGEKSKPQLHDLRCYQAAPSPSLSKPHEFDSPGPA